MTTPEKREDVERVQTIGGESLAGMNVVGWRWKVPLLDTFTYAYAHHWSTGPDDAERLYSETDVRALLEELRQAQKRNAEVSMLAHRWMVAHDRLKAGEQYDFPSPADLPASEAARLKAEAERDEARYRPLGDNHHNALKCPYCNPTGFDPSKAEQREKVLVEAVKPFAKVAKQIAPEWGDDTNIWHQLDLLTVGNFRRAALSLSEDAEEGNQEHTVSVAESGGSPTTSVKSDSPHSAGGREP